MELIRTINAAAKDYTPAEKPLNETHPMTRMMIKAMDADRLKKKKEKETKSVKKSDKVNPKHLSDYVDRIRAAGH